MNVTDVELDRCLKEMGFNDDTDMLEFIWKQQSELVSKYLEIERGKRPTMDCPVDIDSAAGQAVLKDFAWRVTEEIGEAMSCLKNKPWKQTQVRTDKEHFLEELSDAFHFFLELCMLAGVTSARDLMLLYFSKSIVNRFRQRSNY